MVRRKKFLELRVTLSADAWVVRLSGLATVMLGLLVVAGVVAVWAMVRG